MSSGTKDLRKFGLTVGAAFIALGGVSWWRGHALAPTILLSIGVALLLGALAAPSLLSPVERAWTAAAEVLGYVNTRLILGLLFFAVVTPIALVMRVFRDPLDRSLRDEGKSNWTRRPEAPVTRDRYEQQF